MTTDFKVLLKGAKLPERTVQICLRGDLRAQFEAAERQLDELNDRATDSLTVAGKGELLDRIDALQAEMRDFTYTFVVRAMARPAFRALVSDHPPRRDADNEILDDDKLLGVNGDTFWEALIRAAVIDPVMDDDEWAQLFDAVTDWQFEQLANAAWLINRGEIDVPFSRAASKTKRDSGGA